MPWTGSGDVLWSVVYRGMTNTDRKKTNGTNNLLNTTKTTSTTINHGMHGSNHGQQNSTKRKNIICDACWSDSFCPYVNLSYDTLSYVSADARAFTLKRTFLKSSSRFNFVALLYILLCFVKVCVATTNYNECDFKSSGLEQSSLSGVQPVYLSCLAGSVEWAYPKAGLRVMLRLPTHAQDFRACFKVKEGSSGARFFVEGHRTLLPLPLTSDILPETSSNPHTDSTTTRVHCFTSYNGHLALYLEAETTSDVPLTRKSFKFEYHLKQLSQEELMDPLDECRPCVPSEVPRLVCTSVFVSRGTFLTWENDEISGNTWLIFKAKEIYRNTSGIFVPFRKTHLKGFREASELSGGLPEFSVMLPDYSGSLTENFENRSFYVMKTSQDVGKPEDQPMQKSKLGSLDQMSNLIEDLKPKSAKGNLLGDSGSPGSPGTQITSDSPLLLGVSIQCGARVGPGEFLVLGEERLGEPRLKCALPLSQWGNILGRMEEGEAECELPIYENKLK